jgi:co-chaperonin GroES (HSP10)
MFQSPLNNVVVQVDHKYHKDFTNIQKRAALNPGSQINGAEFVNVIGKVVSIPHSISTNRDYEGFTTNDIYPGDTAIFRYDVIYDFVQKEDVEEPVYKNLIWFKGKEYFMADIQKVFGVIRAGEIIMVNGYCMVENMSNPSALILPQHLKNVIQASSATLTHIGRNRTHLKDIKTQPGDTIYYNPTVLQNYEINGKKFGILSQRHILGRKIANYADIQALI